MLNEKAPVKEEDAGVFNESDTGALRIDSSSITQIKLMRVLHLAMVETSQNG